MQASSRGGGGDEGFRLTGSGPGEWQRKEGEGAVIKDFFHCLLYCTYTEKVLAHVILSIVHH